MRVNAEANINLMIRRCKKIIADESISPETRLKAMEIMLHCTETMVGINMQAERMRMMYGGDDIDDGK